MRKTKFNLKKTSRASVSVMLSFLMLPVYTFAGAVTDAVKISSAQRMVSSAADLAVNAGLSDYDDVLRSVYGLFAVSENEEELQKNLSEYFYRTINNTAFTEEDTSERKYISSIADLFSNPSDDVFGNLISLNTETFSAEFTDGAVLASPAVLKSQITEYMKYSGPLIMSRGIISKLGALSDFKNQNQAMKAKIEYDKSLEDINRICGEIWTNASAYNRLVSENRISGLKDIPSGLIRIRELYNDAVSKLLMYRALHERTLNADRYSEVSEALKCDSKESGQTLISTAAEIIKGYTDDEFQNRIDGIYSESDDFLFVKNVSENADELAYIRAVIKIYREEYSRLGEDKKKEHSDECRRADELDSAAEGLINTAVSVRDEWKQNADMSFKEAADTLCGMCTASDEAVEYLENVLASSDSLLSAADKAEEKGLKWKDAISALADGDVKTSMQSEYDSGVKGLERIEIQSYRDITASNLDILGKVRDVVMSVKFYDRRVCEYFGYSDAYLQVLSDRDINIMQDAVSGASQETALHLNVPEVPAEENVYSVQGDEYPFYRYLQEIYGKNDVLVSDKKSAKKLISSVNALGEMNFQSQEIPEEAKSDILSYISEEKLEKIKQYGVSRSEEESFSSEISGDSAGEIIDGQYAVIDSTSTFFESIGELAKMTAGEGAEDLLVAEYIMQMFSCYTSEKEVSGGKTVTVVPHMMSGVEMCRENNVFYKGEAEYILWGNENMEKNLEYTRNLIFGTRFALNSVYAFTDSEIRTVTLSAATAIAGWTGFGVPVVKTVLVLSLALAETVRDMDRLLDGEAVPLSKNSASWTMKPSGIVNALVSDGASLAEAVSEKAGKKTEDIFKRISDSAEGGADAVAETVTGYVDEFADECIAAAENTIKNVIFECALSVLNNADEVMSEEKIAELVRNKLDALDTSGSGIQSVILSKLKNLVSERAGEIASVICSGYSGASSSARKKINEAAEEVCGKTEAIIVSLRDSVKESIAEISQSVKENAVSGINEAGEMAAEYASDLVGNMMTGVSSALTEKFGGTVVTDKGKISPSSALTLSYSEYLRIFLMLSSVSEVKQRAMLSRTAVLIDINMNNGMKKASVNGKSFAPKKEFNITEAATMITADAEVSVNTWLIGRLIPDGSDRSDTGSESESTGRKKIISIRTILSY